MTPSRKELIERAEGLDQAGSHREALRIWENLASTRPSPFVLSRLASSAQDAGETGKARDALKALTSVDPRNEGAFLELGGMALDSCDYDEAEHYLRRALELNKSRAGFNLLGIALKKQGRTQEAEESYRQSIVIDPAFDEAYYNLGVLLESQPLKAEAMFHKVLELDPNYGAAHRELGWVYIGTGRFEESEAHLLRAIELRPDDGWAHIYLGNLLWRQNDEEGALTEFARAHNAWPDWAVPFWSQALLYETREDLSTAQDLYAEALRIDPDDPMANRGMGRVLTKSGQPERAAPYLRRALELEGADDATEKLLSASDD